MTSFQALNPNSSLTDVLSAFPRNSELLLHLLNDIMCNTGELTRGEREAVAAFVSGQNDAPYCVFYHTAFSEVFCGPIEETNKRIEPLLRYVHCLHAGNAAETARAFEIALNTGWSEAAIYEVTEVSGIFNFVNTIVKAARLAQPRELPNPMPTVEDLAESYVLMAKNIRKEYAGPGSG